MTEHFETNAIDSPRLISEMLLTHIFSGKRIDLYANADRIATDAELKTLRLYVKRSIENEPVQYIVGKAWFNGMEFDVDSSTLIPRTCTETIVDQALQFATQSSSSPIRIADIGTGSGCIAVSIAANLRSSNITATDISENALKLAEKNAVTHGVENQLSFLQGNGVEPIISLAPFDIICSNPPYIPDSEITQVAPNIGDWEPKLALSGGVDGLDIIRPLIENAPNYLVRGGLLLIEIASSTKDEVLQLATSNQLLFDAKILRDRFGDDRFLRALRS